MKYNSKILFLMPALAGGGAERTLINLLHKIDHSRYDVDMLVVTKSGPYVQQVPEDVNIRYLFENVFLSRVMGYLHRTFNVKWYFKKKMSEIEKEYDVGISFLDTNFTDLLFYTDKFKRRVAFIHSSYKTHENYDRFYRHEKYHKKLKDQRYSNLDGLYFVSDDSLEEFREVFGEFDNMKVIYNMIDKEAVIEKAARDEVANNFKRFSFSAVGSLIPIKGFDRLIRAAVIVKQKNYDFEIHLVGAGPEENRLKILAAQFGLEENVIFYGFLNNPYPVMKKSDVFVMSSISEALPTVLCEAMILGVPSVVTNCSGCRGLVERGEYGLMAEQNDADLAEKMISFMEKPDLIEHYGKQSLKRAELFDDAKILKEYYDLFEGKHS